MALNMKKGAPALSKAEAKEGKGIDGKKAVLKGVQATKKEDTYFTHFQAAGETTQISLEECSEENNCQQASNQAGCEKLCDTDVAKVNTLIRSAREKTYVRLVPDYDALDVANKIEII
ncbi:large ribosomal subunit protein uL23-like [Thomomys bottae]